MLASLHYQKKKKKEKKKRGFSLFFLMGPMLIFIFYKKYIKIKLFNVVFSFNKMSYSKIKIKMINLI